MKWYPRFRFSLALLLLTVLTVASGMLVWEKWPAWKLEKSWLKRDLNNYRNDSKRSQQLMERYFNRLAGIEAGDPSEVYETAAFWKGLTREHGIEGYRDHFVLVKENTARVVSIYDLVQEKSIAIFPALTELTELNSVSWCKSEGHYFFVQGKNSQNRRVVIIGDVASASFSQKFDVGDHYVQDVLRIGKDWYAQCQTHDILNLATNEVLPFPPEYSAGRTGYDKMYRSFCMDDNPYEIQFQLEKDYDRPRGGSKKCMLWDLRSGQATPWKEGYYESMDKYPYRVRRWKTGTLWEHELIGPDFVRALETSQKNEPYLYFHLSPDGRCVAGAPERINFSGSALWDPATGKLLHKFPAPHFIACFTSDNQGVITSTFVAWFTDAHYHYWRRQHPEFWYGIAYTFEFWLTLILSTLLLVTLRRNLRALKT